MKLTGLFSIIPAALLIFSQSVCAENVENGGTASVANYLASYSTIEWNGDALSYESEYGTLSFAPVDGKTEYSAEYLVNVPDGAEGFRFFVDIGNYYNLTGGTLDAGGAVISFLGADGGVIEKTSTENASENQYFHRYSIGAADELTRLPNGTESVKIRLCGTYRGAGTFRLYFRNLSLEFGKTEQMSGTVIFTKSDKLATVQVGMNRMTQFIWIGVVVVIAFAFLFIRKFREKNRVVNKIEKKPFRM